MRFEFGTHPDEVKIVQTLFDIIKVTDENTNVYVELGYREGKSPDAYEDWVEKIVHIKKFFMHPKTGAVEAWGNGMDVTRIRWSPTLNAMIVTVDAATYITNIAKDGGFDE